MHAETQLQGCARNMCRGGITLNSKLFAGGGGGGGATTFRCIPTTLKYEFSRRGGARLWLASPPPLNETLLCFMQYVNIHSPVVPQNNVYFKGRATVIELKVVRPCMV